MNLRDPIKEVLKELNRLNSLNLTTDNVDFVSPHTPATADEIFFAKGKNTVATLVAKQGAPGLGKEYVYYDRTDISTMFASYGDASGEYIRLPVDVPNVLTARDVVPAFVYYYGIDIKPEHVEPAYVNKDTMTVRVRFEPECPGFTGETIVKLESGGAFLAPNFPVTTMDAPYTYPYFNTKVGQGSVYAYGFTFDDYAAELKKANTTISMERLAAILAEVTYHPWSVFRLPTEYNLKEAKVVYNGPNHTTFKSNPLAENVLIIDLSLYCINLGGQMILHYADPS